MEGEGTGEPLASVSAASNAAEGKTGNKKKRSNPAVVAAAATATTTADSNQDDKAAKKKKKDLNAPGGVKKKKKAAVHQTNIDNMSLVEQVMYRLTEGIPRMELKSMTSEADQCEQELQYEIKILEAALKEEVGPLEGVTTKSEDSKPAAKQSNDDDNSNRTTNDDARQEVNLLLESPFTPLDKYFTLSSLLGRLRDDLAIPSIRNPPPGLAAAAASSGNTAKKKKAGNATAATYPQLVGLANHPNYTRVHPDPPAQLLHVWRKIASHRTAMVFRRAVKPEEAPGYADRISFPMDLSLVRKMIVARLLTSYSEVHQKMRLISHNCVKYNGRESDYGIVAREFEAAVDEYIVAAVNQTPQQAASAAAKYDDETNNNNKTSGRSSPKNVGGGSGRSTPKNVGGGSGRSTPKNVPLQQQAPSADAISAATEAAAAAIAK